MRRPLKSPFATACIIPTLDDSLLEIRVGFADQLVRVFSRFRLSEPWEVLDVVTKELAVKEIEFDFKHTFAGQVVCEGDVLVLNLLCGISLVFVGLVSQRCQQDRRGGETLLSI
jgi:hypothetical protein